MTEFLRDSFTDVDGTNLTAHTGETGATWTKHPVNAGDIKIASNTARGDGTNVTYYTASGTPATADYSLDIDVTAGSLITQDLFYLWGRRDTVADTGYFCRIYRPTPNVHVLGKAVAGVYTVLSTYSADVAAATTYHWLFTLTGTSLEFKIDGVSRATATDSSITAKGKAGITTRFGTQAGAGLYADLIVGTDAGGAVQVTGVGAIASAETFGVALIKRLVGPTGVASLVALGSPAALRNIGPAGIASLAAAASPALRRIIGAAGVTSAEAFGRPTANGGIVGIYQITGVGAVASLEQFGTPKTIRILAVIGITSGQAFGIATLAPFVPADASMAGRVALADFTPIQLLLADGETYIIGIADVVHIDARIEDRPGG